MNTYRSWEFYQRLGTIIDNLPMDAIVSYEIKGGCRDIPEITIKAYLTDPEGNAIIDIDTKLLATRYKIVPIEED